MSEEQLKKCLADFKAFCDKWKVYPIQDGGVVLENANFSINFDSAGSSTKIYAELTTTKRIGS